MLSKVDHVAFVVKDLDREIAFYRDVLGLEFILRRIWDEDYVRQMVGIPDAVLDIALLKLPGKEGSPLAEDGSPRPGKGDAMLELIEYKQPKGDPVAESPNTPGNAHIAFLVDDMDTVIARLREANTTFISKPLEVAAGPNKGRQVTYVRDPDGIIVQLMQS
jgi:catechol 2,3-dioxygenase-like lactoylglutathione lyase family enzyme